MARNLTRSRSGTRSSSARSSRRFPNSSHDSSRLVNRRAPSSEMASSPALPRAVSVPGPSRFVGAAAPDAFSRAGGTRGIGSERIGLLGYPRGTFTSPRSTPEFPSIRGSTGRREGRARRRGLCRSYTTRAPPDRRDSIPVPPATQCQPVSVGAAGWEIGRWSNPVRARCRQSHPRGAQQRRRRSIRRSVNCGGTLPRLEWDRRRPRRSPRRRPNPSQPNPSQLHLLDRPVGHRPKRVVRSPEPRIL